MGFLESLKRTFNIGGCGIEIHLDRATWHQGEPIAGTVRLRGGDFVQEAERLRIVLVEFWTERRGSGKHARKVTVTNEADSAILACPCAVEAGTEREFAFSLVLPVDARLTQPDKSTGWRLRVELEVPGAIDPSSTLELRVEPAVALLELVRVWVQVLRWNEIPDKRRWDLSSRATCFRFSPPVALGDEFDHLDLACTPEPNGDWRASLAFDLQEKSLIDWLKAIIDLDKAERSVRIPAAAVCGDAAASNAFATQLVVLMQGIVDERGKR